ncbi:MAG: hypothetical protein WBV11_11810, partial [Salegentibacter sp.]
MKNLYFISGSKKLGKFLAQLFFLLFITHSYGQVKEEFKPRTSRYSPSQTIYNLNGDFTIIGNTNLTLQNYSDTKDNSLNTMISVDEDKESETLNSSSATLKFSNENKAEAKCSNVVFAGLYWTARTANDVKTSSKREVKFRTPHGGYQTITANSSDIAYPGENGMYVAYAEVTDQVRDGGAGKYWVADMALSTGNGGTTGYYGGWSLIVVYENPKMNPRDITVFDGYAYVEGNKIKNYDLPVSGFNTVQNGPVNMKLGIVAGEGDTGIRGDYFKIKKHGTNDWVSLNHSDNFQNNFFNSSILTEGERDPQLVNNTGIDISMFNIPNANNSVITNNQTSTTFRYGSTQDTYIIFSLAMSVDAYQPKIEGKSSVVSIDGVPYSSKMKIEPGKNVTYKVELRNNGTEDLQNV